ncbi:hypothetical protein EJA72_03830 [Pseudomonas sp. PB120]|uniref:hypothetical protein n=1 Tax=Pseudomonas sp. PB120 TaxID=2494700 RepID=UPI0012FD08F2|nr:hypothetical protein [Pseudomonas sp. PB120]MVV47387.1 hypothetical protein [Pseudomonas sp. PB120]
MVEHSLRKNGIGTINAIRVVRVETTSTTFAMVTPDDGSSRLAIRIGPNITPTGDVCFFVGDKVAYTVVVSVPGAFPVALVKTR